MIKRLSELLFWLIYFRATNRLTCCINRWKENPFDVLQWNSAPGFYFTSCLAQCFQQLLQMFPTGQWSSHAAVRSCAAEKPACLKSRCWTRLIKKSQAWRLNLEATRYRRCWTPSLCRVYVSFLSLWGHSDTLLVFVCVCFGRPAGCVCRDWPLQHKSFYK